MNIHVTIPAKPLEAVLKAKMGLRKKHHPILVTKAHLPGKQTVKVDVLDLQVLINIAKAYEDEVNAKMKARYGED